MNYRDADLVEDLIGKKTFSEVMFMQILGREPRAVDMRIMDAVLITLMEHGFTPSAIATRMIYMSAPENLQGAVAAGLMAVGSLLVRWKTTPSFCNKSSTQPNQKNLPKTW